MRRYISRAGQDSSSELVILMKVFDGMMAQMIQESDLVVFGRHVTGEVPGDAFVIWAFVLSKDSI